MHNTPYLTYVYIASSLIGCVLFSIYKCLVFTVCTAIAVDMHALLYRCFDNDQKNNIDARIFLMYTYVYYLGS